MLANKNRTVWTSVQHCRTLFPNVVECSRMFKHAPISMDVHEHGCCSTKVASCRRGFTLVYHTHSLFILLSSIIHIHTYTYQYAPLSYTPVGAVKYNKVFLLLFIVTLLPISIWAGIMSAFFVIKCIIVHFMTAHTLIANNIMLTLVLSLQLRHSLV